MAKKTMIIHCRCSNTDKPYEMVLEENPNGTGWTAVYTYAIKTMASNASGDVHCSGPIYLGPSFKGCPHCNTGNSFIRCGKCHNFSCWDSHFPSSHCAWCDARENVSGTISEFDSSKGQ